MLFLHAFMIRAADLNLEAILLLGIRHAIAEGRRTGHSTRCKRGGWFETDRPPSSVVFRC